MIKLVSINGMGGFKYQCLGCEKEFTLAKSPTYCPYCGVSATQKGTVPVKGKPFQFTNDELLNHDDFVRKEYERIVLIKLEEEWKNKKDAIAQDEHDNAIPMALNCVLYVLVKYMGFAPYRNSTSRIAKFTNHVVDEINKVSDRKITPYKYMKMTSELCGIEFKAETYEEETEEMKGE